MADTPKDFETPPASGGDMTVEKPIDGSVETAPEPAKEKELTPEERLVQGFSSFNLKEEELLTIPGFTDLEQSQKEMVLENLRQVTLGRIQTEAIGTVRKKAAEAGFLGKIWRSVFKGAVTAYTEKKTAKEIMGGGMETHGEILADLVQKTKESSVGISRTEAGDIEYHFGVNLMGSADLENLEAFDSAANNLIRSEINWEYKGKRDKKDVVASERYEEERGILLETLKEKIGEEEALKEVWDMDRKVKFQQLLTTNPDAEKALMQIEDQSLFRRAIMNTMTEKGAYMAMGSAARVMTVHLMGAVAAPLAAMGVGAWIGRSRAIKSLKEEALLARSGMAEEISVEGFGWEKEKGKEAGETKSSPEKSVSEPEASATEPSATPGEKPEWKGKTILNFVKAENLESRIGKLVEEAREEKDENKQKELLTRLKTRVEYTQAKLEGGLVNFGEVRGQITKKYNLMEAVAEANAIVAASSPEGNKALDERLDRYMKFRGKKVSKKVRNAMLTGGIMGATFAAGGYSITHGLMGGGASHQEAFQGGGGGSKEGVSEHVTDQQGGVWGSMKRWLGFGDDGEQGADTTNTGGSNKSEVLKDSTSTGNKEIQADSSANKKGPDMNQEKAPEKTVSIKKGGNLWSAARSLMTEKKISEKEFADAWQNSKVMVDGKEIPISKVALVHEGDELQFVPEAKGGGGHFEVVNTSKSPLGDEQALYDIYVKKNSEAPEWLKDALGIKDKPPEEMMPNELAKHLKNIKLDPTELTQVLTKATTPGPIEIPAHITEALQADSFRRGLTNLYNDMETSSEDFDDMSLLGQEMELQKYADFNSNVENYLAYKDRIPAWDIDADALEKAQDAYRELSETFAEHQSDFWSDLKKMGVTEEMYKEGIGNKPKLTVDDFKNMFADTTMHEKWQKFAQWVLEMKPKDGKEPLDLFVRENYK